MIGMVSLLDLLRASFPALILSRQRDGHVQSIQAADVDVSEVEGTKRSGEVSGYGNRLVTT